MKSSRLAAVFLGCVAAFNPARAQESAPASIPASIPVSRPADLAARLAVLETQLEAAREADHVAGMAIAIVVDDKIVMARGFGLRDVDTKAPATEKTLFAIGSSSKAFTSAALAMLIDEGKLKGWDEPARPFVPGLKLKDPKANDALTIRDLLCHRVGLMRTDLCWYAGKSSADDILAAVARAEPVGKFRRVWNYSNPMFLAAGLAAAKIDGTDWHTLVKKRIFTPLGMARANTSIVDLVRDADHATGYDWNSDTKAWKRQALRDLTAIAPAGAINASALDMAQWLRFQLGRGTMNGQKLVSGAQLEETWKKQIDMPGGGAGYGLGWMVHDWNGQRYVEHGGNIDGFSAEVAMLPDAHAGVVVLTNANHAGLAAKAPMLAWEALFPPTDAEVGALPASQLQEFVGTYPFKEMKIDCAVMVKNGHLHVDVPGQTLYELKWPNAKGFWVFKLTQAIKVDFERDARPEAKGRVVALRMHQAGAVYRMAKKGVPQPPPPPCPVSAAELHALEGTYLFEPRNERWKLEVRDGRLGFDVPTQTFFVLKWPDAQGRWVDELTGGMSLTFKKNANGEVEALDFLQGGQTFVVRKVSGADSRPLPSLDELLAKRAVSLPPDRIAALGDARLDGAVDFVHQGVGGSLSFTFREDRFREAIDLGVYGRIDMAFDGTGAFERALSETTTETTGVAARTQRFGGVAPFLGDLRGLCEGLAVTGEETIGGVRAIVLKGAAAGPGATETDGDATFWVDATTGLTLRLTATVRGASGETEDMDARFENYQPAHGVRFPGTIRMHTAGMGDAVVTLKTLTPNVNVSSETYRLGGATSNK